MPEDVDLTRKEDTMERKRFLLLAAMVLVISLVAFLVAPHELFTAALQSSVSKHNAAMKKVDKKWKVDKITAKKGDDVMWSASDSDLYFQFMDSTLFGEYTYTLKKPKTLTLKVKGASGTYKYAIFRIADSTYVEGNSPPTIIIP
jgi:plastocyanin